MHILRISKNLRSFSIVLIVVGVFLIIIAAIRGTSTIITLAKGLYLTNYSNIRLAMINVLFNFIAPITGGVLLIIAGIMLLNMHQSSLTREATNSAKRRITHERFKILDKFLNEGEKKILNIIKEQNGRVLQSELIGLSGYSKVKVHRILKRLETQDIIRRSRFGITNSVMLNREESPQIASKHKVIK